jgi:hypothetical protein
VPYLFCELPLLLQFQKHFRSIAQRDAEDGTPVPTRHRRFAAVQFCDFAPLR